MNITTYVKNYGHLSLDEMPFNNVDALIMAQMAYINWELIAPTTNRMHCRPIVFRKIPIGVNKKINAGEFDSRKSEVLFKLMKDSKRFGNTKVQFVCKHDDLSAVKQFFGVTLTLPNGITVISFRGTDLTLNGWKEDCFLSFEEQIPSQAAAVEYINKVMKFKKGGFYLVGHSKGGNLAHYAAANIDTNLRRKLICAYSFDGPGFNNPDMFEERKYLSSMKKMIRFVPQDDVVGIMLYTKDNPVIIKSSYIGVFQHDPFSWQVTPDKDFRILKQRTHLSHIRERAVDKFLKALSPDEKREITEILFNLMGKEDNNLIQMVKNIPGTIKHFTETYGKLSKEKKQKLTGTLLKFLTLYKTSAIDYVKEKQQKTLRIK